MKRKNINIQYTSLNMYLNDRIVLVSLKRNANRTNESLEFYKQLHHMVQDLPKNKMLILLGDLNMWIGNNIVSGTKQRFNKQLTQMENC